MKDLNKLAGLMCQYYDVTGELKTSPIMKAYPRDGKVCTLWDMYTYEEGEDNEYLVRRITSEEDGAQAIMSTSIVWL